MPRRSSEHKKPPQFKPRPCPAHPPTRPFSLPVLKATATTDIITYLPASSSVFKQGTMPICRGELTLPIVQQPGPSISPGHRALRNCAKPREPGRIALAVAQPVQKPRIGLEYAQIPSLSGNYIRMRLTPIKRLGYCQRWGRMAYYRFRITDAAAARLGRGIE